MVAWSENDNMFSEVYDDRKTEKPRVDWFALAIFAVLAIALIFGLGFCFGVVSAFHRLGEMIAAGH